MSSDLVRGLEEARRLAEGTPTHSPQQRLWKTELLRILDRAIAKVKEKAGEKLLEGRDAQG